MTNDEIRAQAERGRSSAYQTLMLLDQIEGEREARRNLEDALRKKDAAMDVLFERLSAAGVDCSDLFS